MLESHSYVSSFFIHNFFLYINELNIIASIADIYHVLILSTNLVLFICFMLDFSTILLLDQGSKEKTPFRILCRHLICMAKITGFRSNNV